MPLEEFGMDECPSHPYLTISLSCQAGNIRYRARSAAITCTRTPDSVKLPVSLKLVMEARHCISRRLPGTASDGFKPHSMNAPPIVTLEHQLNNRNSARISYCDRYHQLMNVNPQVLLYSRGGDHISSLPSPTLTVGSHFFLQHSLSLQQ
jgi:hypothetical protein